MTGDLTYSGLTQLFKEKIIELQAEPTFERSVDKTKFATGKNGDPAVKLAIGNVPLDYDLWEGLRNPAVIGMHPVGLQEIWEFYANRRRKKIDETGRQSIFQIPRSFDFALANYQRAVITSVMLPFSANIVQEYVSHIIEKRKGSSHIFASMYEDINRMLDKAVTRAAIDLVTDDSDRVVVAFDNDTVKAISTEAVPKTKQGDSHGPDKGGNYPQKSIAALVGLGQFGVSRLIFRDEIASGKVERFAGPIRSIIIFDKQPPVIDGHDGIVYPSKAWRQLLSQLFDFTNIDGDINRYRFCSHIPLNDKGCNKCISYCPSGAQASSASKSDGQYPKQVLQQTHRFWAGNLQFDNGKCCEDRGQMMGLFPEWSCSRCLTVCVAKGIRRKQAVQGFYQQMSELTEKETRFTS